MYTNFAIILSTLIFVAAENLPKLSINVRNGNFAGVTSGLDPTLSWSSKRSCDETGLGFEYGMEAGISDDVLSMPKSLFGVCSVLPTEERAWGVAAKTSFSDGNFTAADIDLDIDNEEFDTKLHLDSKFNYDKDKKKASFLVDSIQADKTFTLEHGSLKVSPRYDFSSKVPDVVVSFDKDGDVGVEVNASKDFQSVTVSGRLNERNKISPTVTSEGDLSLEWEHTLGDIDGDNGIKTTYRPNESVDIDWKDKGWSTSIHMDIEDHELLGPEISFKKIVTF